MRGLESQQPKPQPIRTQRAPRGQSTATPPPSREGRVLIGGHFAPEVQINLKVIAAQERTTVQALLAEGINAVFAKRRKPEIAAITPE
jgi:hypothetical protein